MGRGKFDPMQLTNKSKKTFELDSTEFEALIQLDVACSHLLGQRPRVSPLAV